MRRLTRLLLLVVAPVFVVIGFAPAALASPRPSAPTLELSNYTPPCTANVSAKARNFKPGTTVTFTVHQNIPTGTVTFTATDNAKPSGVASALIPKSALGPGTFYIEATGTNSSNITVTVFAPKLVVRDGKNCKPSYPPRPKCDDDHRDQNRNASTNSKRDDCDDHYAGGHSGGGNSAHDRSTSTRESSSMSSTGTTVFGAKVPPAPQAVKAGVVPVLGLGIVAVAVRRRKLKGPLNDQQPRA